MFRSFDLVYFENEANELLNRPDLKLIKLTVSCSEETASTPVSMRFSPCERQDRKYERYLKRFIATPAGYEQVDNLLNNSSVRLIKLYSFPTAEGLVLVVDYQIKKEKGGLEDGKI